MSVIVDLLQGSQAWNDWRRNGIGGSDAPVIEGISPYRTMRDLYFDKADGQTQDEPDKEFIFAKGHETEAIIRKGFQEFIKDEITPVCMQHDEFWHLRASLDGFHPKHGVLEAKLVGQDVLASARRGEIPPHHYSQMQHQFAVSGADVGQWFGHDGKKTGVILEVRANVEYIKNLMNLEHLFWDAVQQREVPPLSERDYFEPLDVTLLQELREAKETAENAAAYYDHLKTEVVSTFKHPRIKGAGIRLYRTQREGPLSLPKVPEIAEAIEIAKAQLDHDYIESFRGKGSESWTIQIEKPKAKA